MIDLRIPNQRQAPKSTLCGPTCIKMVLDCLGIEKSIEEICKLCEFDPRGTLETGLALGFVRSGVKPILFTVPDGKHIYHKYANMSSREVATRLRKRGKLVKDKVVQRGYQEMADLTARELVRFEVPSIEVIEAELDAGNPWVVCVQAYPFYRIDKEDKAGLEHFVIIQGYTDKCFIVNDPAPQSEGGKGIGHVSKTHLLYCMYSGEGAAICVEVNSVTNIRSDELVCESGTHQRQVVYSS